MKLNHALLAAAAMGAIVAPNAHAATKKHVKHHAAAAPHDAALRGEVNELKAQIASLREEMRNQRDTTATTQTQVAQTQAQVAQTQTQVSAINQEITNVPTKDDVKSISSATIASAVEKEHHNDTFYFKGIKLTPGGFLELAGIYRQHNQTNDIATNIGGIPFPSAHNYYEGESRLTARQSRVSFLAEGMANQHTKLSMYGEFDFQGAAQTANSNESNSYNPRIRVLYGTVDYSKDGQGLHFLAGQNWSLVTMQSKGITPRAEVIPLVIDAQYVAGFAWTRTPQVRFTADFLDHKLWIAASAENPQTTFGGSIPATVTNVVAGGSGFNSANNLSLNTVPDFVGKVAYDDNIGGHQLHIEGFGLQRTFTARVNGSAVIAGNNVNKGAASFGGSINFQVVPQFLDVQFTGMAGKGIGRYGAGSLPDVTFDSNGTIHPIHENLYLAGVVLHPTKMLDIYGYAGEELQRATPETGAFGTGNLLANDSGCFIEGGTCGGNTRRVREATGGLWQKIYQGSFGRAQVGLQYSYTQRDLFISANSNGVPRTDQSIGLISFRYYPF
ncbi:hypothetical protein [Novosphingobium sp.]|uniref:hypothetical protein n=1 Tax=Novosphingobium sp. TaxID=1874826 RepID=UPI003B5284F8